VPAILQFSPDPLIFKQRCVMRDKSRWVTPWYKGIRVGTKFNCVVFRILLQKSGGWCCAFDTTDRNNKYCSMSVWSGGDRVKYYDLMVCQSMISLVYSDVNAFQLNLLNVYFYVIYN
jgi:hypothetical protein